MGIGACISLICLLAAYGCQFFWQLEPCFLCALERIPHWGIIAVYGTWIFFPKLRTMAFYLSIGLFSLSISLALYHIGIEKNLWGESALCARQSLPKFENLAYTSTVFSFPSCRNPQLLLFGISMSVYNLFACIVAWFILMSERVKFYVFYRKTTSGPKIS